MGWSAGRKLLRAVDGLTRVIGIEILTAARALDLRAPLVPAVATGAVVAVLRTRVAGPDTDRWLAPEIEAAVELTRAGAFVDAVEATLGTLQ
jgi:histidine ammonia-lyase